MANTKPMSEVLHTQVTVTRMPVDTLNYLRPYAMRDGHQGSQAGILRYAAIKLTQIIEDEKRMAEEEMNQDAKHRTNL
jgi:hypothetical protein